MNLQPLQPHHEGGCVDLCMAGLRLRLEARRPALTEHVTSVMVPPAEAASAVGDPDWTVRVEESDRSCGPHGDVVIEDRPALVLPRGGPRLVLLDNAGRLMRLRAYRGFGGAPVLVEVDVVGRTTSLLLPAHDRQASRWVDWLAKVFFASRLLASGWQMLHASAVAVDGAAVLFLAAQGGGKSTLAYRACMELGVGFLADDLVLVSPSRTVIGWPTRVALPADLFRWPGSLGVLQETRVGGAIRRRVLLSPPEYRAALAAAGSPPLPLGALVSVISAARDGAPPVEASEMDEQALAVAVTEAVDVPAQRLHTSDLLGLTGGPSTAAGTRRADQDVLPLLAGVPGVLLRVGDPARLASLPLWDALAGPLPRLSLGSRS